MSHYGKLEEFLMTPQELVTIEGQIGKLDAMTDWIRTNLMTVAGPAITHAVINDISKISKSLRTMTYEVPPSITLDKLTPSYLEALWRNTGQTTAAIRECSICDVPLAYKFELECLFFDSGCDCNTIKDQRTVTWPELTTRIKDEPTFAKQRETAKLFGVDLVLAMPVVSSVEAVEILHLNDDDD
jgi:hypothetical protein